MRSHFTVAFMASMALDANVPGVYAIPRPEPIPITEQQAHDLAGVTKLTDKSAADVCTMKQAEAATTWKDSGADAFLTGYLSKQGSTNWLRSMDGHTTGNGQSEGILDCRTLGDKCELPVLATCPNFTPPAFYWIRLASSNFHSALGNMHETLQDSTIRAQLGIAQMVQDFASQSLSSDKGLDAAKILTIIGAAFSLVGAAAGPVGGAVLSTIAVAGGRAAKDSTKLKNIGEIAAAASDVLQIAGTAAQSNKDLLDSGKITLGMSNRLLQAFTYFSNTIEDMRSLVFDGREDPNGRSFKFADLGITGTPPVASFFKDGRLLFDAKDGQTKLNGQFQQVMTLLKKSLIAGMLHDLKAYIVRDSSQQGRDRLCKKTGSRLVGNECFFIVRASEKRGNEVEEIGNDAMLAFDKYGINIEHLYSNAAACQDKNPSFDGWDKFLASAVPQDLLASTVAMDGNNYPECFWGALPVFTVTEESRKKAIDRADIDGVCVSTANPEPDQNQTPNVPKHLGVEACPGLGIA